MELEEKVKNEPRCEACGKNARELFEKGRSWVCRSCRVIVQNTRGHITKSHSPIVLRRGKVVGGKSPSLSQYSPSDTKLNRKY